MGRIVVLVAVMLSAVIAPSAEAATPARACGHAVVRALRTHARAVAREIPADRYAITLCERSSRRHWHAVVGYTGAWDGVGYTLSENVEVRRRRDGRLAVRSLLFD